MLIVHFALLFMGIGLYGEDQAASVTGQNPVLEAIMKDPSRARFDIKNFDLINEMTDEEFNRAIEILAPTTTEVDLKDLKDKQGKKSVLFGFIEKASNGTNEELGSFLKWHYGSHWEEVKEYFDENPQEKRRRLLRFYAVISNDLILTSYSNKKGLYYNFKTRRDDFILDGMGDRSSMVNLLQDFVDQKRSQTQSKDDAIENLPTTGQIDAFNERIRDLPKKQVSSLEVMVVMPCCFKGSLLPEGIQKFRDLLRSIRDNAISHWVNFIFMSPLFTAATLGYMFVDAVDYCLVFSKVFWYWYNGDLYIVDATGIDEEVSKLKKG